MAQPALAYVRGAPWIVAWTPNACLRPFGNLCGPSGIPASSIARFRICQTLTRLRSQIGAAAFLGSDAGECYICLRGPIAQNAHDKRPA